MVRTLSVSVAVALDCDGLAGSPVKRKTSSRFESAGWNVTVIVLVWLFPM